MGKLFLLKMQNEDKGGESINQRKIANVLIPRICLLSFFNIGWKKATFPLLFSRETSPLQFLRNQRRNSLLLLLSLSLSS